MNLTNIAILAGVGPNGSRARWWHRPAQTDMAMQTVRGPTQTDQNGQNFCPKCVGPLEMPLGSSTTMAITRTYFLNLVVLGLYQTVLLLCSLINCFMSRS